MPASQFFYKTLTSRFIKHPLLCSSLTSNHLKVVVASGFGSMTEPEETLIKKAEDEVHGHKANRLCSFTQGPLLTSTL